MKLRQVLIGFAILATATFIATAGFANHAQFYVLDGFGGVHAGGGAPVLGAGIPYFGFDIAKGIIAVPDANSMGIVVLDGFGGIHTAGLTLLPTPTPYFGFDIARDIVYRNVPPRVANVNANGILDLPTTSAAFTVLSTTTINAPDDGFVLVIASTFLSCVTPGNDLAAQIQVNVDATTASISNMGYATWDDCNSGGGIQNSRPGTIHHLFPVSAGAHTVNFLGRKSGGTGTARVVGRSVTAVFIDQGATGQSAPEPGNPDDVSAVGR